MFGWRVTRYDPALRNPPGVRPHGAYAEHTWTSVTDVGRVFGGSALTAEEYLRVEGLYLDAVGAFMADAGVTRLTVRDLEGEDGPASEGEVVGVERACTLVRLMLREAPLWCRLESMAPAFYVHVGHDLYLYLGAATACPAAEARVAASGLFVEPEWASPYARGSGS